MICSDNKYSSKKGIPVYEWDYSIKAVRVETNHKSLQGLHSGSVRISVLVCWARTSKIKQKKNVIHSKDKHRLPYKRVFKNYLILFLNQNICCGYSKEPSFEHPKHMFKLIGKKIIRTLR